MSNKVKAGLISALIWTAVLCTIIWPGVMAFFWGTAFAMFVMYLVWSIIVDILDNNSNENK